MLIPIRQDRITDVVYATLRQNILRRHFSAGERLHVDELAKQLTVSRTPVREALNLLSAEGLVNIVPRSGTFVAHLSAKDLEDVFDVRICLEALAAERVAEKGLSGAEVRQLRKIVATAKGGTNAEERAIRHAEANRAFHKAIVDHSGNGRLAQLYSGLNAHTMMAFIHYASPVWSERWEVELEEHERVIDALERKDPAGAKAAMEAHLRRGRDSLLADMRAAQDGKSDGQSDSAGDGAR
jgi:GntR family transcriptional regulator, rspAB operon transcriptional repressor